MNNCRPTSKDQRLRPSYRPQADIQEWARSYGQLPSPSKAEQRQNRFEQRPVSRQANSRDRRLTSRDKQLSAKLRDLAATIASTEFVLARNMSKHKEAKKGDEGQLTGRDSCSTSDLGAVAEAESFVPRSKSNRAKFVVMRAPESERYRPPAEQLLSTYRDTQQEELKSIIAAKEQELEVVRQKEQSTRKRLTEEVKYLDQNNNALRKQNEELQSCERKLRQSIEKLQVELGECQSKLRRRNNMVSSATETEPAIAANGECQCRQLQERAQKNEYLLKRSTHLNRQYEEVICDLHLASRLYRGELDKCGRSKSPQFIEAERKMLKMQATRKRLL